MNKDNSISVKNPIVEGNIWKELIKFCIPIMLGTLFQQLYNAVDVIVIGHFAGTVALASVGGASGTLIYMIVGLFTGLTSGMTVVVARFCGSGEYNRVKRTIKVSVVMSLVLGIVFGAIGIIFSGRMLILLNTPETILESASLYLNIYFGGIVFVLLFNAGSAILRALGDSKTPLHYLIVCSISNVILDLILVVGFRLGVAGVGIATVISQAISAFLVINKLRILNPEYSLTFVPERLGFDELRQIIYIGFPASVMALMNSLSGMVMQSAVNRFGEYAVAGNTSYAKLDGIFWMVSAGVGVAVSTFVGQNYGAKLLDRVKETIKVSIIQYMVIAGIMSVIFYFTSKYLLYMFTSDEKVIEQALLVMKAIAPYYMLVPIYEVLIAALRGIGNVLVPSIMAIVGLCGIRAGYILINSSKMEGVYDVIISCPISWIVTLIMVLVYYFIRRGHYFESGRETNISD